MGAGGSKIKTKLSPQLGLAKLELGLSMAILYDLVTFKKNRTILIVNPLAGAGKRRPAGIVIPTYTCRQSQTVSQLIVWYC